MCVLRIMLVIAILAMTILCTNRVSLKGANPARGQLAKQGKLIPGVFLPLFAPEILVSRDGFGRLVPRQPAHSPHSG